MYDWYSDHGIKLSAPQWLEIDHKCSVFLEKGKQYVLGCKGYEFPHNCHFVKLWNKVTEYERKLIQNRGFEN
ncbi:hypothetical protein Y032_0009g678 [Ancylostoma ceylanicum]|uniref:Uncharacterized protein n=1 Tax=Ancylostoma ceylanicum TaxID=53326 RepID=A0A016VIW6_9BILA|nr:hypothetical protein Y032_0009g678 [Ancylostoma ceylanicum]